MHSKIYERPVDKRLLSRRLLIGATCGAMVYAISTKPTHSRMIDPIYVGVAAIALECELTGPAAITQLVQTTEIARHGASHILANLQKHRPQLIVLPSSSVPLGAPLSLTQRNTLRAYVRITIRETIPNEVGVDMYVGAIGLRLSRGQEVRGLNWNPSEPFLSSKSRTQLSEALLKTLRFQLDDSIVTPFLSFPSDI